MLSKHFNYPFHTTIHIADQILFKSYLNSISATSYSIKRVINLIDNFAINLLHSVFQIRYFGILSFRNSLSIDLFLNIDTTIKLSIAYHGKTFELLYH